MIPATFQVRDTWIEATTEAEWGLPHVTNSGIPERFDQWLADYEKEIRDQIAAEIREQQKQELYDLDGGIIADAQIIHREICPGTFHDCHETNGKCVRAAKAIHRVRVEHG